MKEVDQENFFMSDSLKDILDKDDLLQTSIEEKAKNGDETTLLGKFIELNLSDSSLTVSADPRMTRALLQSPMTDFVFPFMDEAWVLSSAGLKIKQASNDFEVTLAITGRR